MKKINDVSPAKDIFKRVDIIMKSSISLKKYMNILVGLDNP